MVTITLFREIGTIVRALRLAPSEKRLSELLLEVCCFLLLTVFVLYLMFLYPSLDGG